MTTSSSDRTILVVEDQPEALSLLADALQTVGYRVLTAAHPDDGLAIGHAHAGTIDLVLIDVATPGMNGPEMAQQRVYRHPFPRVLYVSGHDLETLGPLGVPADGPAIVKKPLTMDAPVERVSGALCR